MMLNYNPNYIKNKFKKLDNDVKILEKDINIKKKEISFVKNEKIFEIVNNKDEILTNNHIESLNNLNHIQKLSYPCDHSLKKPPQVIERTFAFTNLMEFWKSKSI